MTHKTLSILSLFSLILVVSCSTQEQENDTENTNTIETNSSSARAIAQSSSNDSIRETENVSYEGMVLPAGISIYMQGSHRLALPGGKFILLESDSVDLNGYVGENVMVYGALRPTVEAGGVIMRVDRIALREAEESSSSKATISDADSSISSSSESFESSLALSKEAVSSVVDVSSSSSSEESSVETSSESSETSSVVSESAMNAEYNARRTTAFNDRVVLMSEQDFAAALWTQQYCTSHIHFCIPVHKNWWYQSFGATTSSLWHVEINSEAISSLGDGPIVLRLFNGAEESLDGQVVTNGTVVVGYKTWTDGRHFEVIADKSLKVAVEYMIGNVSEYNQ